MGDGYDVYAVPTRRAASPEAHDMAIRVSWPRGAQPITWLGMAESCTVNWARQEARSSRPDPVRPCRRFWRRAGVELANEAQRA